MKFRFPLTFAICALYVIPAIQGADTRIIHGFTRQRLTDTYFSEGASAGDLNGDQQPDIVYGPHWYAGPKFVDRHEIYPAVPQDVKGYADAFFSWVHDFDHDGHNDVLVVGFPGKAAYVYRNPGPADQDRLWEKTEVADQVSNEAPQFDDLTGDGVPELICTRDGHFGYYERSADSKISPWTFRSISAAVAPSPFVHGLGVGDVNGDGRRDLIASGGWFAGPPSDSTAGHWMFHAFAFAPAPADMFAYDVDGDGDQDIITSLHAHEYGLAWYENTGNGSTGVPEFRQHVIMGKTKEENPWGVLFTEPHALRLADINGDGLQDLVTGKTYWSHHTSSPMWDAGAVVYWFELQRTSTGQVEYIPHLADDDSGIGRGFVVTDLNQDDLPDIVTGGMKGATVLMHTTSAIDEATWASLQPKKLPKIADGLTPAAAAANMTVPPGFRVQLAAGEPMVHQPVAMCFDHKGRLWVAEAHTYPLRADEGHGKDRIVIFEDTNQDGAYDRSTTFIEGLNLVSGLEVGFGGVYVGAAPYLMFIPDRNGDDKPDGPPAAGGPGLPKTPANTLQFPGDVPAGAVVLRDGFGWQDTHETLNSFIWGPDGWLYGCHGVFTHSRVGRPGDGEEQRLPLNASVWRYHPTRDVFEAFMHGTSNPWGVDFDDHGQAFITACVIPHLWHVIQGGRYHRQGGRHFNPHTYDDIKTIADHAHYVGDIREHAWWGGNEPRSGGATSDAGGGHAHCGAMIYLADNWPAQYRNQIFFNNVHGNRINCDILEPAGSGFVGHHGRDLLLSNDRWYRGINLRYGPDGSVMLIDWYDRNACHRTNPEIWDRSNGRIYRIVYGDQKPVTVDLNKLNDQELVKLLFHSNEWYVRMARKVLMERRAGPAVKPELLRRLTEETSVPKRLRALWTLQALGELDESTSLQLLDDPSEYVRAWTIQLMLDDATIAPSSLKRLVTLAGTDSSAVVRRYVASSLQRIPPELRWETASALARRADDASDQNIPLLLWYAVEPLVVMNTERAVKLAQETQIPLLRRFIIRRACAQNETIDPVVSLLHEGTQDAAQRKEVLTEMLTAFQGRVNIPMPDAWKSAYERLSADSPQDIRDQLDQVAILFGDTRVLVPMRSLLVDASQNIDRRRQALDVLVRGQDKLAADVLLSSSVLDTAALQGPAIRALSVLGNDKVPGVLLAKFPDFNAESRRDLVSTLCSRPDWTESLLKAVGTGDVPSSELHAFHVRQIQSFNSELLNEMLVKHWGDIRESPAERREQIATWKSVLRPGFINAGHAGNGRRIFARTCQNCHRLFGTGGEIGPDITGSNRANVDYLLENMIDPSAVVGRDYQVNVFVLTDGRIYNGLVRAESDSAVTIQTINDRVVIPKNQIEERSVSAASMMPEKQLDSLTKEQVRDLVLYLASPHQVALSGPASPIDAATGKVPGAIEGETLTVVEKSGGTVAAQAMNGFTKDRWSGNNHLWWTSAKPGDRMSLEIPVAEDGVYTLESVLSRAPDYGIVKLLLDDQPLEASLDLFNAPDVVTTGVLTWPDLRLSAGNHRLTIEITGAHPDAVRSFMVGLDYVRLMKSAP